jgi:TonB-dependent SusC/RagA subfamily outer membrane receptor
VVTDATTHAVLSQVIVQIENNRQSSVTGESGKYRFAGITAGTYSIVARRLGYLSLRRTVEVDTTGLYMVDFPLAVSPAQLDQVVTTVTGNQRLREMGNLVETIAADSVVRSAPVTSLSDVISGRVAGVQVFTAGGFSGASPDINIRGQNSFAVTNLPLLYIDGVRVSNSSSVVNGLGHGQGLSDGRFNDIDPAEIESIEVVKGPSAATLYGTDAANGVILVKTKQGTSSKQRWSLFGETGVVSLDRSKFPYNYTAWGHSTDGTDTPIQCTIITVAEHSCAEDSVTRFSPLRASATSPISAGYRDQLGAQVSGGGPLRYFAAGGYETETGPLKMPAPDRQILDSLRGGSGVPSEDLRPNAFDRYNGRINVVAPLGKNADLALSAAVGKTLSRIPYSSLIWVGAYAAEATQSINGGWADPSLRPSLIWAGRDDEDVQHWTGGSTATWHPASWFSAHATGGIDFSTDFYDELWQQGQTPSFYNSERTNQRLNSTLYTADVGATASFAPLRALTSRTSVGGQYYRSEVDQTIASGQNLLPGFTEVSGGTTAGSESNGETIVAGGYVEETIGLNDRLFVTGATRVDQGSAFGGVNSHPIVYPKASATWLISDEPFFPRSGLLKSLRLRAAYGEAGVQPPPTAGMQTLAVGPTFADGIVQTGASLQTIANPHLEPERQHEFEAGADVELADGRLRLQGTYYDKQSSGALVNLTVPPSLGVGSGSELVNVGAVSNRGAEALIGADFIRSAATILSLTLNGSLNNNRLLSLAPGVSSLSNQNILGQTLKVGYPIYSYFDFPILGWHDANSDGVIEPNEVRVGSVVAYRGAAYPKMQLGAQVSLSMWNGSILIGTQFDYRGGFRTLDVTRELEDEIGHSWAAVNPHASASDQAAFAQIQEASPFTQWAYYEDGEFVRWRELSVTAMLPATLTRALRLHLASVTLAARNLAVWTKYRGEDPETQGLGGSGGQPQTTAAAYYGEGQPPSQYWIIRVRFEP